MRLLHNKVCLVTGANRGIGAAITKRFAEEGAIIYANAREEGVLEEAAKYISEANHTMVIPVYFDIRDNTSIKETIMRIKKEQGHLDALVNNAAIMKDAVIGMVSQNLMQETFEINVFATMQLLQMAAKLMERRKCGSIINFTSMVGVYGNPGQLVYSASKGAVISLTKTAAKELAPSGIRVNAVSPGVIDTDLHKNVKSEIMVERLKNVGMGRMGQPEEVADTCVYLASDLSQYVTGQIIGVDGSAVV